MKKALILILFLIITGIQFANAQAKQRFPKPEFESGHTQPPTITQDPRSLGMEYLDVFILFVALSLTTWLVLKKRSRFGVFWVSVFSVVYFGFIREGCVCSVGSLQNVALAIFHPSYSIPITVVAFFVLPLVFSLFVGRTFCAGVCPLGAIQDFFLFKPMPIKSWLQTVLGLIPFIYLGLSLLYAATATDFIICRYDPFVGFFRMNADASMFFLGGTFLFISIFIGRPYCRFLCPYGVLLNWTSRLSNKHMTITPNKCIQCRLCEDSCPYGAIDYPSPEKPVENRKKTIRRFITLSVIIPLLVVLGAITGARFHENLAMVNTKVRLAEELVNPSQNPSIEVQENVDAFREAGKPLDEFYTEVAGIMDDFYTGSWILGAFIGLVFGITLANLSRYKYRTDYTPNKGTCFSCARCMDYCPVEKEK